MVLYFKQEFWLKFDNIPKANSWISILRWSYNHSADHVSAGLAFLDYFIQTSIGPWPLVESP